MTFWQNNGVIPLNMAAGRHFEFYVTILKFDRRYDSAFSHKLFRKSDKPFRNCKFNSFSNMASVCHLESK